jgi:hypothetical protein
VLSVNTVGAAVAPFLFGMVLLPAIGLKTALVLVTLHRRQPCSFRSSSDFRFSYSPFSAFF